MKILIADDHELLRDALAALFRQADDIDADFVADLDAALEQVDKVGPYDLVLLDLKMPGMNELEGIERIRRTGKAQKVAILTGNDSPIVAEEALAHGAVGFIPKTLPAKSLLNAIRFMQAGETYLPAGYFQNSVESTSVKAIRTKLLPREYEVLRHLSHGKSNKEIANTLSISEATVKVHVKAIFRKLEVKNRTEAALLARNAQVE
ncbi:response regulator [Rhodovulum adriaticum]|uniref:DNA-binding NarL/FixJ family response regulator n=1 Tax=Rhodovulum adriaticum TaxID=35804 RepID=A0A4R2NF55_RHOAD|nr:response regulator transcription factor [Rhodovulum adriaticum]MBK1637295.1 DNA-binding response regulator [Rhodovulum adriaticum]TCP19714.1 DNA-binding NarL/FixJ family response regulator [Rhodovulum adriaticum]